MTQARYLTAYQHTQDELELSLYAFLDDLGGVYEEVRTNPLTNQRELEATVNQNFEFLLNVRWGTASDSPLLITFDIDMLTAVEPHRLSEVFAIPAEAYFQRLVLVYNSDGRERSLRLFPKLLDLENAVRELIISIMLGRFGSDWWENIICANALNRVGTGTAEDSQRLEAENKLHDCFPMHALYYMDLKALREIMEKVDETVEPEIIKNMPDPSALGRGKRKKWEQEVNSQLPFSSILENYDEVSIAAKISEIRELRNRLMHGRYLTESNEKTIDIICEQFHRFLVAAGHIGDFTERRLVPKVGEKTFETYSRSEGMFINQ